MKIPHFVITVPFMSYHGMAIFPFICVKEHDYRYDQTLMNHEKIHLCQQLEMCIVPFYLLYVGHYLFNLLKYKNHDEAYRNICFEREAYDNELDLNYLRKRTFWRFWRYL